MTTTILPAHQVPLDASEIWMWVVQWNDDETVRPWSAHDSKVEALTRSPTQYRRALLRVGLPVDVEWEPAR